MHHQVVDLDAEPEDLRRQAADRRQHRIGRHHPIALGGDQRDPRIGQILGGVEHVERGALADAGLLAHAVERDLEAATCACVAVMLALAASSWPQAWVTVLHLVARGVEVEAPLAERLLGLADGGVFRAALVDQDRAAPAATRSGFEHRQGLGRAVLLVHAADGGQGGSKRAFGDLHLMRGDVDVVLRGVDGGMLDAAAVDRARQRARRQAIDRVAAASRAGAGTPITCGYCAAM